MLAAPPPVEAERPRLKLGVAAAVVAGAAALAIVLAIVRAPSPGSAGPHTGSIIATARTQVPIATGTAVVEAGASLTWTGAAIDQRAGTIYYRIERAAQITTPHGTIRTQHASGRVAVGATTVVTIDEGGAVVGSAVVSAGGRAELP